MPNQRRQRVARQILHETSKLVEFELNDPRLGMVTLTAARMSPDLRVAWIAFSILGDEQARNDCYAALRSASGYLRREIGRRLRLKYVPDVRFEIDDSIDRAERISRLIERPQPSHTEDAGEE